MNSVKRLRWRQYSDARSEFLRHQNTIVVHQNKLIITERVAEIPTTIAHIPKPPCKVLDAGCYGSLLPLYLASIGYQVWGVDLREYPFQHANLCYENEDICHLHFPDSFFDVVISISTVEHVGLGTYGDPIYEHGDRKAILELARVLADTGTMVISVPFGKSGRGNNYRVYDISSLKALFEGLRIQKYFYFERVNETTWVPSSKQKLSIRDSSSKPINGCALVIARKHE